MKLVPVMVRQRKRNADGSERLSERNQATPWPPIQLVPQELWEGLETAGHVIRKYGGWHVDRVDHFGTGARETLTLCLVPPEFAAAMATLVDSAKIVTREEAARFCNEKCFFGRSVVERDSEALRGLLAERELRERTGARVPPELDAQIARALDPNDPEPGLRRASQAPTFADLVENLTRKFGERVDVE